MLSEKNSTKYLKAKQDRDQLRRGLNNFINDWLGYEYKYVTFLAEALIILNINKIPSKEAVAHFLQNEQDSINTDIGEGKCLNFVPGYDVHRHEDSANKDKVCCDAIQRQESDSDGQSYCKQKGGIGNWLNKLIEAIRRRTQTKISNFEHW